MDIFGLLHQVAEAVIGFMSVLGNALVFYVIVRHKGLQTITNYFIASLAMADLFVGLVGIPCVITNNIGLPHDFYGCLFTNCIIVVLTQISIFSLMIIAVERCVAVKYPIFHRQHFNAKLAFIIIAVSWVAGFVVGCVPMFGWHLPYPADPSTFVCSFVFVIDMAYMVYFNFFGFVLIPVIIMFATYGYIYYVVHSRRTHVQNNDNKQRLSRESKVAKRIFLVLVLFVVCWLPIHILNSITLFTYYTNVPAVIVAVLLSHANSAMNPFVYALTNTKFSEAFKRTLGMRSNAVTDLREASMVVVAANGNGTAATNGANALNGHRLGS